ncbi:hypothetical protein GCM10007962_27340 [Yeosuana aromativorans]|uniref:T9SS type A sorting domain-containing protein n=1 Tax=Yeosuana aromativorans TaxID=288019 RepID=A0A8J3BMA0_9FLAO|nr:hypothetical protein [Yeosuana aromativorans]GGK31450.1 hypothetical protein GCM10007962_27340 [Yeosuana aromativorans]
MTKKITLIKSLSVVVTLFCAANFGFGQCGIETATWDGTNWNWTGGIAQNTVPTIGNTISVIINGDYDTSVGGFQTSFGACSLTVTNNATLDVKNNTYVEVQNDITVDAGSTFFVQPYGAVVQINDVATVTDNGIIRVIKTTAPLGAWYEYTYWSSPVSGETIGNGLFESEVSRRYLFNAQNFLDATAESNNDNTPVAGQDDIDDNGDDWQWVDGTTTMEPGVGYAATHDPNVFIFPGVGYDYDFQGPFNNGIITVTIYRNDSELNDINWNLIGNPYPSAISANSFLAANTEVDQNVVSTKSSTGAIFFWSQNTAPSSTANGNQAYNFSDGDYAVINGASEIAGGDGLTPNRYIPSGQAFFVAMSNSGGTNIGGDIWTSDVVFNNSMRVKGATDNSQFFKSSNTKGTSSANKLWVNLISDNGVFNQTCIAYLNNATNMDDGMYYDAPKNVSAGTSAILYTTIEDSNKKFAIQGKAASSINTDEVINLGFKTSIDVPTLYTLSVAKKEGGFLTNNPIYLKDNLTNTLHDLTSCDYTFTSEVGEFNKRFEIVFSNKALATDDFNLDDSALKISQIGDSQVRFKASSNLTIKTVSIFDLLGRQLYALSGSHNEETYNLPKLKNAVFIAKVKLSNGSSITKKGILK